MSEYPNRGDTVIHVPTATKFGVTRRTKNRQTGAVELWHEQAIYPADECELLLNDREVADLLIVCEVMTAEDLELLETLTPQQKRQLWSATTPETRARLTDLRKQLSSQRPVFAP